MRKIVLSPLLMVGLLALGILMTRERTQASPLEGECSTTIVYDNYQASPKLVKGWGFGCIIKTPTKTILFDTGGDDSILVSNMEKMSISPQDIDTVVISHIHADHVGGLNGFLKRNGDVKVYVPASFPNSIREEIVSYGAECHSVRKAMQISRDVYSTGEMRIWIKEQSLVLDTRKGIIVITGCAHPGILNIIKKAKEILPRKDIHLVMGGFHLGSASDSKLKSIIREFRNFRVEKAGPCHCSGDRCRELFKKEYDKDYVEIGVGKIIVFENIKGP